MTDEHKKTDYVFRNLEAKRATFHSEWQKLTNISYCHLEVPLLLSVCDEGSLVADLIERIIPFEIIEKVLMRDGGGEKKRGRGGDETEKEMSQFWCWPLLWSWNAMDILAFANASGYLVEPTYFSHYDEIGVSSWNGILKVSVCDEVLLSWFEIPTYSVEYSEYYESLIFVLSKRLFPC